jgi:hypothetical protein
MAWGCSCLMNKFTLIVKYFVYYLCATVFMLYSLEDCRLTVSSPMIFNFCSMETFVKSKGGLENYVGEDLSGGNVSHCIASSSNLRETQKTPSFFKYSELQVLSRNCG